jgi:hypothetical protein
MPLLALMLCALCALARAGARDRDRLPLLSSTSFFSTYHGHALSHLSQVHAHLTRACNKTRIVWLCGDSSLDSKHWFEERMPAAGGLESLLVPPTVKQDLCGHLNALLDGTATACINAAVEESTLGERAGASLLPHDQFIADRVSANDVVVVSVGANDVALQPSLSTLANMLLLLTMNSAATIESSRPEHTWGMAHFVRMFKDDLEAFLRRLTFKTKPRRLIVCMIYYPDTSASGGWADGVLRALGYFDEPQTLQAVIRQLFAHATSEVAVPGVEVVPVPLYGVLDGSDSRHYVAGVEPSARGNEKIAARLVREVVGD